MYLRAHIHTGPSALDVVGSNVIRHISKLSSVLLIALWHLGSRRLPINGSPSRELSMACLGSKVRGLRNLEIAQKYCAISRLHKRTAQSQDW